MIGLVVHIVLEIIFLGALALVISRNLRTDIASALHFALLATMSFQGLSSLIFFYTDIPLSFSSINTAIVTGIALTLGPVIKSPPIPMWTLRRSINATVMITMTSSYLVATIAGVLFFSTDLIPSSMTGDPPRHFQALVDLRHSGPAMAWKPIYYLWAGTFVHLPLSLAPDQLFVIFNILTLGLVVSSVTLVAKRALGELKWFGTALVILLTAFGYPLFALQYGYYALLLSAVFLFSSFAVIYDYLDDHRPLRYLLFSTMGCGVILTHSYLAPQLFLIIIFAATWQYRKASLDHRRETLQHLVPGWILIGSVTVLANSTLATGNSLEALGQIVQAKGWGTDNFWGNILSFAILAAPYLIFEKKSRHLPFLVLLFSCSAGFSLVMYALYKNGLAAPYYVTRNHLILIPILVIGTVGTLEYFSGNHTKLATAFRALLALLVLLPYFFYSTKPLAKSDVKFLDLLGENGGLLFLVTAKTTNLSPLQFTARDRALLTSLDHPCFDKSPPTMLVLGTDHSVIWFGIYANLYPSLMTRQDGFIERPGYIENYQLWKRDVDAKYIGIIKHMDYLVTPEILSEIKSSNAMACEGDSFVVYRKPSQ